MGKVKTQISPEIQLGCSEPIGIARRLMRSADGEAVSPEPADEA